MVDQQLVSVKAFAERFNVSTMTVRRWINRGKIPALRVGAQYRINLEAATAALTVNAKSPAIVG